MFDKYIARLCDEIAHSRETAQRMGALPDDAVDTVYFGGGTPTLLDVSQLDRVFANIRQKFEVPAGCEITMECAPGTLSEATIECLARNGVNRVSLGVQSFVDQEARSVGRLHNRETVLNDIARLRSAGISNINVDLIAGLPHQTLDSWGQSLDALIAIAAPHASVYMLEVDEDSRLGRELIAGGQKYHAHFVPDEDLTADMYEIACERLNAAGIEQYEISNFARPGFESKHNLKYWTRQPYLGFGVDAHSMLLAVPASELAPEEKHNREGHDFQSCRQQSLQTYGTAESHALPAIPLQFHAAPQISGDGISAIRFSNPDSLEKYLSSLSQQRAPVSAEAALQEAFFLGLRLNRGVDLAEIAAIFGADLVAAYSQNVSDLFIAELLEQDGTKLLLTPRGRLLSNEVFSSFISVLAS